MLFELAAEINEGVIVDADISRTNDICYISIVRNEFRLMISGVEQDLKSFGETSHIRHVRWISKDGVAVWSFFEGARNQSSVKIYAGDRFIEYHMGYPRDVLYGGGVLFAGYGEEQYICAKEGSAESQLVAAFDETGAFLFGINSVINNQSLEDAPIDFQVGCADEQGNALCLLYPSDLLWIISPRTRAVEKITIPLPATGVSAVARAGGNVVFATRTREGFKFESVNLKAASVEEIGFLSYQNLLKAPTLDGFAPHKIQIHGCQDGSMVIAASNSIWHGQFT